MNAFIKTFDRLFTVAEKTANLAGSIPVVATVSGPLRVLAGSVQAVAGTILAVIFSLPFLVSSLTKRKVLLAKTWKQLIHFGVEHMFHGIFNGARGTGETLLGGTLGGFGNLVLLIPNLLQKDKFAPFFTYGSLTKSKQVVLLKT